MVITGLPIETIGLDLGVIAEPLHVGTPFRGGLIDLKDSIDVLVDTAGEEVHDLPERGAVDIKSSGLVSA